MSQGNVVEVAFPSELADIVVLFITCEDCGRTRRWSRAQIAEVERRGVRTLARLGSKLCCKSCAERGQSGAGYNVSLDPKWRGNPRRN